LVNLFHNTEYSKNPAKAEPTTSILRWVNPSSEDSTFQINYMEKGTTISHYQILEKLGEGGMGVVYKARDTKLDRIVALKFLPSHPGTDKTEKQRFLNEAKAASALDHSNICAIHSIEETGDGNLFIVMAYYEGLSLKEKIEQSPLPINDVVNYAIQIASGLQKAHEKGIVHRDLKPANIFITNDDQVKIIDFGLAKAAQHSILTKSGTTLGTVPYMSPEQAQGGKVDHRTDIWSLGVVMYEMITGQRPFQSEYETALVYSITQ
jgi:eukaryotic-like serine/threonine-protein kinase